MLTLCYPTQNNSLLPPYQRGTATMVWCWNPMFTGNWADEGKSFYNFLGTNNQKNILAKSNMKALFIDPDTGVNHRGGKQHVLISTTD